MHNQLLFSCLTVYSFLSMSAHCFSEMVIRRKYRSTLMDEAVCKMFVRRLYSDGNTFCFEFPYTCGAIKTFPPVVYRITKENCMTVPLFKDYIKMEFEKIRKSKTRNSKREKVKRLPYTVLKD